MADSNPTVPASQEEIQREAPSSGGIQGKALAAAELAIALGISVGCNVFHILPIGETPWIILLGFLSLRLRRQRWSAIGLVRPASWGRTLAVAASAAAALQFLSTFVSEPLISRVTRRSTDLSSFEPLVGNVEGLLRGFVLIWTLAAFGEEFAFRGYLLNRAADLGSRSPASWIAGLVGVSALFGLGHLYQGSTGAIDSTLTGLLLGGLYLATGRNLWAPILAHGISDTIALVLIFAGAVPGVGR